MVGDGIRRSKWNTSHSCHTSLPNITTPAMTPATVTPMVGLTTSAG